MAPGALKASNEIKIVCVEEKTCQFPAKGELVVVAAD